MSISFNFFLATKDELAMCDAFCDPNDDVRYEQAIDMIYCWPIAGNLSHENSSYAVYLDEQFCAEFDKLPDSTRNRAREVLLRTVCQSQGGRIRTKDVANCENLWKNNDAVCSILGVTSQRHTLDLIYQFLSYDAEHISEELHDYLLEWKDIFENAQRAGKFLVIYAA